MKLFNFPFVKLTICLISGIIISYLYAIPFENISYLLGFLLAILTISFFIARQQFVKTIWFGIMALVTTVSIGDLDCFHS